LISSRSRESSSSTVHLVTHSGEPPALTGTCGQRHWGGWRAQIIWRPKAVRSLTLALVAFLFGTAITGFEVEGSSAAEMVAHWSIVPSPNTGSGRYDFMEGVSCISASNCTAVGYYYQNSNVQTLIERWNGTGWSIVASPDTSTNLDNYLNDVSCTSSSGCTAVGYHFNGIADQTLIERSKGSAWSIVPSPDMGASQSEYLSGVSCPSRDACTAVGAFKGAAAYQVLIEQWNGTRWSIVRSHDTGTTEGNYLSGVSCVAGNTCTAVGDYFTGTAFRTLVERRLGTSWSITSSPNMGHSYDNKLTGVSCTTRSACAAVGDYDTATSKRALIEHFDKDVWSIVASPNAGPKGADYLNGISCTSKACIAVGAHFTGSASLTLIERRVGSYWSIIPSPNVSTKKTNSLNAVSCTSPLACTAVGYYSLVADHTLVTKS